MGARRKPEAELDLSALAKLLSEATRGPWRIDRGLMAESLWITAHEREGFARRKGDGPICHVSTENHRHDEDRDHFGNFKGFTRSWKEPIKKAEADAKLIVAAVNALPELLRRLGYDGSEAAWLVERDADRFGPVRWWAAGEAQFVINANDATRFARKADAEAVIRSEKLSGVTATEHMWIADTKGSAQ